MTDSDLGTSLRDTPTHRSPPGIAAFRETVLAHYREQGRDLPWRHTRDPYRILVSEVMLQQTQASRVTTRYEQFLTAFPSIFSLSRAAVADVLLAWQGLGYNRRALALHQTAQLIVSECGGHVPCSPSELQRFPGVGPATAAAVCVFAYNIPVPFIETNIRSAFIHTFFEGHASVSDNELLPLVEACLDRQNPRDWYQALMDYGAWIKGAFSNPSRRSEHYVGQTPFAGSRRQARALILRMLLAAGPSGITRADIRTSASLKGRKPTEIDCILQDLVSEGFLQCQEKRYRVS